MWTFLSVSTTMYQEPSYLPVKKAQVFTCYRYGKLMFRKEKWLGQDQVSGKYQSCIPTKADPKARAAVFDAYGHDYIEWNASTTLYGLPTLSRPHGRLALCPDVCSQALLSLTQSRAPIVTFKSLGPLTCPMSQSLIALLWAQLMACFMCFPLHVT